MFSDRRSEAGRPWTPRTSAIQARASPASASPRQWLAWRRSAQRVTRAWNEWLAADRSDRPDIYRCYLTALAEEERAAAEVERVVTVR